MSPTTITASLLDRAGTPLPRRAQSSGGLDVAYHDNGAGRPVVLVHGILTTLEDMVFGLGDALHDRYRVVAFDRPGCGGTAARRGIDAGLYRQADRLLTAIEGLGLERPIVVGHSLGASIALTMATLGPERLGGVVALAPLAAPEARLEMALFGARAMAGSGPGLSAISHASTDRLILPMLWRAMFLPDVMPDRMVTEFPFAMAGRADVLVRVAEDALAVGPDILRLLASAPKCRTPVEILGGDRDLVVANGRHGQMLAALMPQATFSYLPGRGHMIHHFEAGAIRAAIDRVASRDQEAPRSY